MFIEIPTPHNKNYFYFLPHIKFDSPPNNNSIKIVIQFMIWGKMITNNFYILSLYFIKFTSFKMQNADRWTDREADNVVKLMGPVFPFYFSTEQLKETTCKLDGHAENSGTDNL